MVKGVAFVYPTRMLGGAELLFIRVAKHLALDHSIRVGVVDYSDGFIARQLVGSPVEIIPFTEQTRLEGFSHVVAPPTMLPLLDEQISVDGDARLLLWLLHPLNFLELFPGHSRTITLPIAWIKRLLYLYNLEYLRFRRKVQRLSNLNAIVYMDEENWRVNRYLFDLPTSAKRYLPVPIPNAEKPTTDKVKELSGRSLDLVWLGRLANFKVTALNHIIQEADKHTRLHQRDLTIHVIGTGPSADKLYKPLYAKLKSVGVLQGKELYDYLREKTSILFAMGTSSLEGGQMGLPTVLVDASYTPFPSNYRFRWLHQTRDFTLGRVLSLDPDTSTFDGSSFDEIVNEYLKAPDELGQKAKEYVQTHHSLNAVCEHLLQYLGETKAGARWRILGPAARSINWTKKQINGILSWA
jgi:hypothetical protein